MADSDMTDLTSVLAALKPYEASETSDYAVGPVGGVGQGMTISTDRTGFLALAYHLALAAAQMSGPEPRRVVLYSGRGRQAVTLQDEPDVARGRRPLLTGLLICYMVLMNGLAIFGLASAVWFFLV